MGAGLSLAQMGCGRWQSDAVVVGNWLGQPVCPVILAMAHEDLEVGLISGHPLCLSICLWVIVVRGGELSHAEECS